MLNQSVYANCLSVNCTVKQVWFFQVSSLYFINFLRKSLSEKLRLNDFLSASPATYFFFYFKKQEVVELGII